MNFATAIDTLLYYGKDSGFIEESGNPDTRVFLNKELNNVNIMTTTLTLSKRSEKCITLDNWSVYLPFEKAVKLVLVDDRYYACMSDKPEIYRTLEF